MGDVLTGFKHLESCVVVTKHNPRHEPTVRVVDVHGRVHILSAEQIDGGVTCITRIELPTPIAVRTKHFRISTSIALKKALSQNAGTGKPKRERPTRNPGIEKQTALLDEYVACEKEVVRLTRRVQSRGQSLARQFERILSLLSEYGYVQEWTLTQRGEILTRINAECDLVIADYIASGDMENLNPQEFAALLATFVFETRKDGEIKPNTFPTKLLGDVCRNREKFVNILNKNEREAGIKESRPLDYGMMFPAYLWAQGHPLDHIIDSRDIAGGDFVRAMKSVIDLVRQIETASSSIALSQLCRETHAACFRDIIEVSS